MTTTTTPATVAPVAVPARTESPPERRHFGIGRALAWTFMILVILLSLFPFYWMLRTALSSNNALYAGSESVLPVQASWGGFERVFGMQTGQEAIDAGGAGQAINFWRYLLNSVVVATLITAGQVFFSAMAAYAFARLQWKHREKVFAFFLAGLMIPAIFTLLPNFVLIKQL
jgi:multiple sugar transport system permease protein